MVATTLVKLVRIFAYVILLHKITKHATLRVDLVAELQLYITRCDEYYQSICFTINLTWKLSTLTSSVMHLIMLHLFNYNHAQKLCLLGKISQ